MFWLKLGPSFPGVQTGELKYCEIVLSQFIRHWTHASKHSAGGRGYKTKTNACVHRPSALSEEPEGKPTFTAQ